MSSGQSLFISIYTDEDITSQLAPALRRRGYNARSTAEMGNLACSDEEQLAFATAQGMAILTCNAQDFIPLAQEWSAAGRGHCGIIITSQVKRSQFGELLRRVLVLLDTLTADEIRDQVLFLQRFKG